MVPFLASHPEVLQEFGFRSFGELAPFAASQDPRRVRLTSERGPHASLTSWLTRPAPT